MLKTLLKTYNGRKTLVGPDLDIVLTNGNVKVDNDNPFHQKLPFIKDLEQFIEKEYRRFEKAQLKV
jgi:hypothetical protein